MIRGSITKTSSYPKDPWMWMVFEKTENRAWSILRRGFCGTWANAMHKCVSRVQEEHNKATQGEDQR